ncbi:hypothetical protein JCM8097_001074 [Rhodosporidiobolus ruineniae]
MPHKSKKVNGASQPVGSVDSLRLDQLSLKRPDKADHLSCLPPELIRRIFDLAYEDDILPGPLSKALLPFHLELVYDRVALDCYGCLKRFIKHVLAHPDRGKLVKHFRLSVKNGLLQELVEPVPPSNTSLTKLFAALPNLLGLELVGDTPVVALVLKPFFAKQHLRLLAELTIDAPFFRSSRPFHPSNFTALRFYPSLTLFDLEVDRPEDQPLRAITALPSLSSTQHFGRLTSLRLSSTHLDGKSVEAILRSCLNLEDLALSDGSGEADVFKLVEVLPEPERLETLTLCRCYEEEGSDDTPLADIVPFLHRTPNLKWLNLLGRVDLSSSFFACLHDLPSLKHLEIGPQSLLFPSALLDFLTSDRRHPSLSMLTLDNIFAVRGDETDPDDWEDVWLDEAGEGPVVPPGWLLPVWTSGWDESVVEEVRTAAENAGIEVDGSTFAAAEIEADFEDEVDKVEGFFEMLAEQDAFEWEREMMASGGWRTEDEDEVEDEDDEDEDEEEDEVEEPRRTLNDLD